MAISLFALDVVSLAVVLGCALGLTDPNAGALAVSVSFHNDTLATVSFSSGANATFLWRSMPAPGHPPNSSLPDALVSLLYTPAQVWAVTAGALIVARKLARFGRLRSTGQWLEENVQGLRLVLLLTGWLAVSIVLWSRLCDKGVWGFLTEWHEPRCSPLSDRFRLGTLSVFDGNLDPRLLMDDMGRMWYGIGDLASMPARAACPSALPEQYPLGVHLTYADVLESHVVPVQRLATIRPCYRNAPPDMCTVRRTLEIAAGCLFLPFFLGFLTLLKVPEYSTTQAAHMD